VRGDESLPYPDRYLCFYPQTKAIAERAVLAANRAGELLTVSLRPHLIWGPRDNHLIPRLIQRARSGQLRQVGDGTNEISMAYVENVAAAHLQACDALSDTARCAGRAYFINEPEPVRLWDWVNQLLQLAGLPHREEADFREGGVRDRPRHGAGVSALRDRIGASHDAVPRRSIEPVALV
jgi:nucleoside-diphosphate-sugar epimerase